MWGGIDDAEVRAVFLGGVDDFYKTASVRGDDDRGILVAMIVPTLSACLRVEVDDDGLKTGGLRRTSQVEGQCGLTRPALLRNDGNCFHTAALSFVIVSQDDM